jgi:hypothetical protein
MIRKRGVALALLSLILGGAALAQEEKRISPMPSHLPLGVEACFGRVYDADHLKRHPQQRVTSFHLFRDFTPDALAEEVFQTRQEMLESDGDHGVWVHALVRVRDRKGVFSNTLLCRRDEGNVRCGVECDGGSFVLRPENAGGLMLQNNGFVVVGGCGDDEDKPIFLKPEPDDRSFRLDKQPIEQCTSLRDEMRPAYAKLGTPLRVRLDTSDLLCFSREYDAGHLAKHPQQTVKRIAVVKAAGKTDDALKELTFHVEFKNGRKFQKKTTCYASRYAFSCTHNPDYDTSQDFYLTRAGDQQIMLRDSKGKLNQLFGTRLGSDDRTFKLSAAPAASCRF